MGVYHYFGNESLKEYLECPSRCPVKWGGHWSGQNCSSRLFVFLITTDWEHGEKCYYSDSSQLPWDKEEGWVNITSFVWSKIESNPGILEHFKDIRCFDEVSKIKTKQKYLVCGTRDIGGKRERDFYIAFKNEYGSWVSDDGREISNVSSAKPLHRNKFPDKQRRGPTQEERLCKSYCTLKCCIGDGKMK